LINTLSKYKGGEGEVGWREREDKEANNKQTGEKII